MPDVTGSTPPIKGIAAASEPRLRNEKPDLQQQGFAASCLVLVLSALAVFGYAAAKYQREQAAKEAARAAAEAEEAVAESEAPTVGNDLPSEPPTL